MNQHYLDIDRIGSEKNWGEYKMNNAIMLEPIQFAPSELIIVTFFVGLVLAIAGGVFIYHYGYYYKE